MTLRTRIAALALDFAKELLLIVRAAPVWEVQAAQAIGRRGRPRLRPPGFRKKPRETLENIAVSLSPSGNVGTTLGSTKDQHLIATLRVAVIAWINTPVIQSPLEWDPIRLFNSTTS